MRLLVFILVLVLHALFGVFNSTALMYPQDINLGFAQYTGPLGLLLLATSALVWVLSYLWLSLSGLRSEAGYAKLLRDMDSLRQSLDTQEASRFAQLQAVMDTRFGELEQHLSGTESQLSGLATQLSQTQQVVTQTARPVVDIPVEIMPPLTRSTGLGSGTLGQLVHRMRLDKSDNPESPAGALPDSASHALPSSSDAAQLRQEVAALSAYLHRKLGE